MKQETHDSGRLSLPGDRHLSEGLLGLIRRRRFPCVAAKSALAKGGLRIETAGAITSPCDDLRIHDRLARWSRVTRPDTQALRSIAFVFAGPRGLDEEGFEAALVAIDAERGYAPAPGYSENPADPDFALSIAGHAYYAIGMHPHASRRARRAPSPTIARGGELRLLLDLRATQAFAVGAFVSPKGLVASLHSVEPVSRYATVGAPAVAAAAVESFGAILPLEARAFPADAIDEARRWVAGAEGV